MSWTDARVSIATRMWAGGATAGDIAQELGDSLTRNAVLGMLNRRGLLKTRPKPEPGAEPPSKKSPSNSGWTDERAEKLKKLWADGQSASEIGKALGVTRLAVIGKAHRMGLTAGTRLTASAPPTSTRTAPAAPKVPAAPRARILDATGGVVGTAPAPLPPPELVVVGQAVVLADLPGACCKYPVGPTPAPGDMHLQLFCAAPTGDAVEVYCAHHKRIAFKSVTPAEKAKRLKNDVGAAHRDMLVRNTRRHSTGTRAVF